MLTYIIIIFSITAIGGLVLASYVLRGKLAPWAVSLIHAGLGALGLVLLALLALSNSSGAIVAGLIALVIAALGGFYLASFHFRKKIAPSGVVLIHAGVAVVGFLILVGSALSLI